MHLLFVYYHVLFYILIIIDRGVDVAGNGKYFVSGLSDIYKLMLNLSIPNILNPELFLGDHIFYNFVEVHKKRRILRCKFSKIRSICLIFTSY